MVQLKHSEFKLSAWSNFTASKLVLDFVTIRKVFQFCWSSFLTSNLRKILTVHETYKIWFEKPQSGILWQCRIRIDLHRLVSYKDTRSTWTAQCIYFTVSCVSEKKPLKIASTGIWLFTKLSNIINCIVLVLERGTSFRSPSCFSSKSKYKKRFMLLLHLTFKMLCDLCNRTNCENVQDESILIDEDSVKKNPTRSPTPVRCQG